MWIFLFSLLALSQVGSVLTQTVGTSAYQVVTSREVKASKILGQLMKSDLPTVLTDSSNNDVNGALIEIAIYREAQGLNANRMNPQDLDQWVQKLKPKLSGLSEWKKLEVQDEELRRWIERKQTAESFLELKTSAMTSIVTDNEIQEYYEKNRSKFGSTPLQDQKESIRRFLQKQSRQQRLQDWLATLRVKHQIRHDSQTAIK